MQIRPLSLRIRSSGSNSTPDILSNQNALNIENEIEK